MGHTTEAHVTVPTLKKLRLRSRQQVGPQEASEEATRQHDEVPRATPWHWLGCITENQLEERGRPRVQGVETAPEDLVGGGVGIKPV